MDIEKLLAPAGFVGAVLIFLPLRIGKGYFFIIPGVALWVWSGCKCLKGV